MGTDDDLSLRRRLEASRPLRQSVTRGLLEQYSSFDSDLTFLPETRYRVGIQSEVVMEFGESEGVIRLLKPYDSLPASFRGLVDQLKRMGYALEEKK